VNEGIGGDQSELLHWQAHVCNATQGNCQCNKSMSSPWIRKWLDW